MTRVLLAAAALVVLAGCGFGLAPGPREPVPAEVLGPVFPNPEGGPDIECRGVEREQCTELQAFHDGAAGVAIADVRRVIVTCLSDRCTRVTGGEFRLDVVLRSGVTQEIAGGAFGSVQAPGSQPPRSADPAP